METTEPKQRISVYLPSALKQKIEQEADVAGQALSIWVERALTFHLNQKDAKRVSAH